MVLGILWERCFTLWDPSLSPLFTFETESVQAGLEQSVKGLEFSECWDCRCSIMPGLKFVCFCVCGGRGRRNRGSGNQSFLQARYEVLVEVLKRGILEFSGRTLDVNVWILVHFCVPHRSPQAKLLCPCLESLGLVSTSIPYFLTLACWGHISPQNCKPQSLCKGSHCRVWSY